MNFLSHYFADREESDSLFVIGAATPDLLSIYNAKVRVKAGHVKRIDRAVLSPAAQQLIRGLDSHFLVDRVFHSSELFKIETGEISDRLEEWFPDREIHRKYFIAHILLELLMDKVLISKHNGILDRYYAHYVELAPFTELREATEEIIGTELPNYEAFLQRFLEKKYLAHYRSYSHLAYVMERLLRRVGVKHRNFTETGAFIGLMEAYETHLSSVYLRFFEEIEMFRT